MRILECIQGSDAWHAARLGIPTASAFGKILTPGGKPSSSAAGYMHALIAARLLNMPVDDEATEFMGRGLQLEAEAVRYYELQRDAEARRVGFVLDDSGRFGCSPDRLIGDDGGLEVKCPSAAVHVGYLLDDLPVKFQPQVQGCLWITGRHFWDVLSYNPELPPALVRVERDEEFIRNLASVVGAFCDVLDVKYRDLTERFGLTPEWRSAA
jgi:hypothetical protein